jgi:hypothetical protein
VVHASEISSIGKIRSSGSKSAYLRQYSDFNQVIEPFVHDIHDKRGGPAISSSEKLRGRKLTRDIKPTISFFSSLRSTLKQPFPFKHLHLTIF